jgi:hypothetical protein
MCLLAAISLQIAELAAWAESSPPRPPFRPPGRALIGKQRRQPRLRLAPLLCLGIESRSQVTDDVVLLGQALAQHLDFDL